MRQLFFIFILISNLTFAKDVYKSYYYFHHTTTAYLSKQTFLYKMNNFNGQSQYYNFLTALSDKYFNVSLETLVPVKLPNAHTSSHEFVKLPKYGEKVSSYLGVEQKANNIAMAKRYQCSELVNRFYRKIFGIFETIQRNGIITAKEYDGLTGIYDNLPVKVMYYPVTHANLVVKPRASFALNKIYDIYRVGNDYIYDKSFNNNFQNNPPTNGSILSFANNFHSKYGIYFGHTAIVKKVIKIKNGYRLYCFEQNVIKGKKDTISLNRYITFIKNKGHWQEMGSGILGDKIGRIGPVVGWSKPYFIKHIYVINKLNFHTLIIKLIESKYFNLAKYKKTILKPIKQSVSTHNYVTKSLYNAIMHQIILANTRQHEGFFHKLLQNL